MKVVAQFGVDNGTFRPTIGELIAELETNPKQFPKKKGALKDVRAAEVTFADGITWRAVFTLDEHAGVVSMLSLAPHDVAYKEAKRRV